MQSIKGLLFDKDGTLFDFEKTWSTWTHDFLKSVATAQTPARNLAEAVGFDLDERSFLPGSVVIAGTPMDIVRALAPHLPSMTTEQILLTCNESAAAATLAEALPLKPFVAHLRSLGQKLGISTNDAEAIARQHLEASGVLAQFDHIYGYDSGYGEKPRPGMQYAFCEAAGLDPENVAMVGDSLHDLHAGRAAGMTTIGVLTGCCSREELTSHADMVLDHIGLIPNALGLEK